MKSACGARLSCLTFVAEGQWCRAGVVVFLWSMKAGLQMGVLGQYLGLDGTLIDSEKLTGLHGGTWQMRIAITRRTVSFSFGQRNDSILPNAGRRCDSERIERIANAKRRRIAIWFARMEFAAARVAGWVQRLNGAGMASGNRLGGAAREHRSSSGALSLPTSFRASSPCEDVHTEASLT